MLPPYPYTRPVVATVGRPPPPLVATAAGDAQWDATTDPAAGWDAAPAATGVQSEEAGPVGGGSADESGFEDSWSSDLASVIL